MPSPEVAAPEPVEDITPEPVAEPTPEPGPVVHPAVAEVQARVDGWTAAGFVGASPDTNDNSIYTVAGLTSSPRLKAGDS